MSFYSLIDSGDGLRLERFGLYSVVRPDANVLWKKSQPDLSEWQHPDALFLGDEKTPWQISEDLKKGWWIDFGQHKFWVKPMPFRHLGLFPEQEGQWQWLREQISFTNKTLRVLNVFAYTGAASVVAAAAGAEVCHVESLKSNIFWAKENAKGFGLSERAIRWIQDDALSFMRREVRRGNTYDIILMDPPVFGRGSAGQIWRLEKNIPELATLAAQLLVPETGQVVLNFYATSLYPESIQRVFEDALKKPLQLKDVYLLEEFSKKKLQTGFSLSS